MKLKRTVKMSVFKVSLCFCALILSVHFTNGEMEECVITSFRGDAQERMCEQRLGRYSLKVKKHEDFVADFENPDVANENFAPSSEGFYEFSMESVDSFVSDNVENELQILVNISNTGVRRPFNFSAIDINSLEVFTNIVHIDGSRLWTTPTVKLTRQSRYKVSVLIINCFVFNS